MPGTTLQLSVFSFSYMYYLNSGELAYAHVNVVNTQKKKTLKTLLQQSLVILTID